MAYFVVQVQTNFERDVLKTLTHVLMKKKINIVRSIYALNIKVDFKQPLKVTNEDIREHLKQVRIRDYLNNKRYKYSLFTDDDHETKQQFIEFVNQISKLSNSKQNKNSFIRGYIIVEITGNFEKMPSDLYHDIKSIPRVISIPSKYNIPDDEVEKYLNYVNETIKEGDKVS